MIFCSNVCGLNGRKKQRSVASWLVHNKPLIGGILESRIKEPNIGDVLSKAVPGWNSKLLTGSNQWQNCSCMASVIISSHLYKSRSVYLMQSV